MSTTTLNIWPVSMGASNGTVELGITSFDGRETYWVDRRDQFGFLLSAEPFGCQDKAREYALKAVYGGPKESKNFLLHAS